MVMQSLYQRIHLVVVQLLGRNRADVRHLEIVESARILTFAHNVDQPFVVEEA